MCSQDGLLGQLRLCCVPDIHLVVDISETPLITDDPVQKQYFDHCQAEDLCQAEHCYPQH